MKLMKKILLAVVVLVAIPFVIALFVKNEYVVQRTIIIKRPQQEVFGFIKLLKNQDSYNKWVMMDPRMKKEFKGKDGTVGSIYAWEGEKAGKGEQEIVSIIDGKRIETALRFIKPMESTAFAWMGTEALPEKQTKVTWGMRGANRYPMNFMNLFMNELLGNDLATSLAMLKNNLEN